MVDQKGPFCYNDSIMWFLGNKFKERQCMNKKFKAALITAGLVVWCVIVAVGLKFSSQYVTVEQFSIGLVVVGISLCLYGFYSLILTKLEFDEKISELVDRK